MEEKTKAILRKWGAKLKKGIFKINKTDISLEPFEKLIVAGNIDGTIAELQRLKKFKKKLKKEEE